MKTKITCISDTHQWHRRVQLYEECDILIFAGDFLNSGYISEEWLARDFLEWFDVQNAKHKILVAGNHDRICEDYPDLFRKMLKDFPDITYLEDEWVEIEGLKIYGTPHSKHFCGWAFNRSENQLEQLFDNIPEDVDILVSHVPAYGILDKTMDGESVGEKTLRDKIKQLANLKLHVFGHLHNDFGIIKPFMRHISVNCAQVDEAYDVTNQPITVWI